MNDITKLKYIVRLFRDYFKSSNLEVKIHVYVFTQRNSVIVDICKLTCQVAPPAVGLASKMKVF